VLFVFFKKDDNIIFIDAIPDKNSCEVILEDVDIIRLLWKERKLRFEIAQRLQAENDHFHASKWLMQSDFLIFNQQKAEESLTLNERIDAAKKPIKKETPVETRCFKNKSTID